MKKYIEKCRQANNLTTGEAALAPRYDHERNRSGRSNCRLMVALRAKGETIEEIAVAQTMRAEVRKKFPEDSGAIDMCGTGGDCSGTFNISTVALCRAGAGATGRQTRQTASVFQSCRAARMFWGTRRPDRSFAERRGGGRQIPSESDSCSPRCFHPSMKYAGKGPERTRHKSIFNILDP